MSDPSKDTERPWFVLGYVGAVGSPLARAIKVTAETLCNTYGYNARDAQTSTIHISELDAFTEHKPGALKLGCSENVEEVRRIAAAMESG